MTDPDPVNVLLPQIERIRALSNTLAGIYTNLNLPVVGGPWSPHPRDSMMDLTVQIIDAATELQELLGPPRTAGRTVRTTIREKKVGLVVDRLQRVEREGRRPTWEFVASLGSGRPSIVSFKTRKEASAHWRSIHEDHGEYE